MTYMPLLGCGLAIRMDILNEAQAQKNHGQSLQRLAERGGLSPDEALAIVQRRAWKPGLRIEDTVKCLAALTPNAGIHRAAEGCPVE